MKYGTLCYLRRDGKTLMLHRNKKKDDFHEGHYVGVGGHREPEEGYDSCAIREVLEETGIRINKLVPRGMIIFRNGDRKFSKGRKREDYEVKVYFADDFEGEAPEECAEGSLEWVADGEITGLPMWEGDRLFTLWLYERDDYFEAELFYDQDKLVNHRVKFIKTQ